MRRICLVMVLVAVALAGCGRDDSPSGGAARPAPGTEQSSGPGFAAFATKNTTRVAGANAIADSAAVAQAVYPGGDGDRPSVITVVPDSDWHAAIAAAVFAAKPLGAPILLTGSGKLAPIAADAIESMDPRGARTLNGAQLIRVGKVPSTSGRKAVDVSAPDEFALARAIDALAIGATRQRSDTVIVVGADKPEFAMPAAALAAKTGASVLFTEKDTVPAATREAITAHGKPRIVVIGPADSVGPKALAALRKLGRVVQASSSDDPVKAAIDVAQFSDAGFGWGIVDPGHGLVFARSSSTLDAAAAAPFSANGTYGPLLLIDDGGKLPNSLKTYLRRIQPGYAGDPTRGVYNRGWIIGSESAISPAVQSEIDALLEIKKAR